MKSQLLQLKSQLLSIVVTALIAAAISFLQSLITSLTLPAIEATSSTDAGFIGAALRFAHLAILNPRSIT